jgi:hypothetical protein
VWTLSTLPIQETARAIGAGGEIVAEEAATLYRAVSKSELDDIAARGLQLKPGGYESKLFATSFEDAVTHGRDLYNVTSVPFNVVEISFPKSMLNQFESLTLDFKPAVNVPGTMLPSLNSSMTWKYFPYLPLP